MIYLKELEDQDGVAVRAGDYDTRPASWQRLADKYC